MPARVRFGTALLLSATVLGANEPPSWRFGLEDTWGQLGEVLLPAEREALAAKMAPLTAAQAAGGDVNVNGLAGGWHEMQPSVGAPIDFTESDAIVLLLQRHRFTLLWNLRINAAWASAGNPDCFGAPPLTDCAPDAAHLDDLYDYIRAVVERYDGDGIDDMGFETPAAPSDDLEAPVRFYLMTGEIQFAGANSADPASYGDSATAHFWSDTIPHLLETHRIVYRAIRDADPSGASKLVSSGGVLWDLYADFPDWPAIDGPTVAARLAGANNHNAVYTQSYAALVEMLQSFGDDSDGVECDYVGWHPHMPWREIEQTFAFIRAHAGAKPIYVDDMWTNLFLQGRADAPGYCQFTDCGTSVTGDFPNFLVHNYTDLRNALPFNFFGIRDWYQARTARNLVKAYASAFGEGAERVSFSGNADFALDRLLGITGYLNLMGTLGEGFAEKPAYWTYRLLVEKLHDFTAAVELPVSNDPRTRLYRFDRPRGPIWIGWSESGAIPPGLDYDLATGETVTIVAGRTRLLRTRIVDEPGQSEPPTEIVLAPSGSWTVRLGFEPLLVEPEPPIFADGFENGSTARWSATGA